MNISRRRQALRLDPDRRRRLRLRDLRAAPGVVGWSLGLLVLLTALLLLLLDHLPAKPLVPVAARILGDVNDARDKGQPRCVSAGEEAPPGRLRYPRGDAQGRGRGEDPAWYLVSRHDAVELGLLPVGGCRDLTACVTWASLRLGCTVDPPGTARADGGMTPGSQSAEEVLAALAAGARLAVLPAAQVHPGLKVVAGPFDAAGAPLPGQEDLLVSLTGLLEEPLWLENLRGLRYQLLPDGEGRPPLQHLQGFAGPGWVYVPLGPRWGMRDCEAPLSERIPLLWRLGELVLPPVRQNPVLVSTLGVFGVDACLRDRLGREANAAGFFVAEEEADLEHDIAPPLMLRSFSGEVLAIWEIVVTDSELRTMVGRLRSFGAPSFARLREIDTVFHVAAIHWRDGAPRDASTRKDRDRLLETLADLGFHVVLGIGGRDAGPIRGHGDSLLISDLGELSGPGDLMTRIGPPEDLGWVLQCTVVGGRPFQCYPAPVLRYLGEPALFREPRFLDGAACWWRGDEIFSLLGNSLAGDPPPCYPSGE